MSDSTTTQQPTRGGACLCGNIRFEMTGEPFVRPLCHCNNCRKMSGSSFGANLFFKQDQVKIFDEQKFLRTYLDSNTGSGKTLQRQFCGNCGSTLFVPVASKNVIVVPTGAVDDTTGWHPNREFFCRDRQDWVPEISGTMCTD